MSSMLDAEVDEIEEARAAIVKAYIVEPDQGAPRAVQRQRSMEGGEEDLVSAGALDPPYDPLTLSVLFEHSNCLRPNVDAYATNIDGFGHRLEPAIDLTAENADKLVSDCIYLRRVYEYETGSTLVAPVPPTTEEIAATRTELVVSARLERTYLDRFFRTVFRDGSFVQLRKQTRQDRETTGNAYWEVLRNNLGQVARFVYVPAYTVRLLPLDQEFTHVDEQMLVTPVDYGTQCQKVRFRRFVQIDDLGRTVYFKEFGDPRCISAQNGGIILPTDGNQIPATEMVHWRIHSPRSPYGVPRWIGSLLAVMGSRRMEEVNFLWFDNKAIPPLAILVSGGRLASGAVNKIKDYIKTNIKGHQHFHDILILESAPPDNPQVHVGQVHIEIKPLTDAWLKDEMFGNYDERNMDKVGGSFRLPRLLRGESKDFNRATALSTLIFAEDQVFQPERDEFDFWINHVLFPNLGIRFWRFRSNSPMTRDPERMSTMVEKLVTAGVLTPAEGRELASDIFNHDFVRIDAPWTRQPIAFTLAGIQQGLDPAAPPQEEETDPLLQDAAQLTALRTRMLAEAQRRSVGENRFNVPPAVFQSWVEPDATTDKDDNG